MTWIYLSTLIFGGIFLVPMMLGGMDLDGDVDFDFDADSDLDVDFDTGGAIGDFVGSLVSFRSIVFFATFFGLSGIVFDNVIGRNAATALTLALVLGAIAAFANTFLMRALRGSENDSSVTSAEISGARATVVLPLAEERKGRIRALVGGQEQYFVALPHRPSRDRFDVGDPVVVVEIQDGTALVAPLPGLEMGESD